MAFFEMLLSLVGGAVYAVILTAVYNRRGSVSRYGFPFFFILLALGIWAGGVWTVPAGPRLWNIPWLSYLLIGLMITLLFGTVVPPRQVLPFNEGVQRLDVKAGQPGTGAAAGLQTPGMSAAFNPAYWALVLLFGAAILIHYISLLGAPAALSAGGPGR